MQIIAHCAFGRCAPSNSCGGLKIFVATDDVSTINHLRACSDSRRYRWTFNHFPGNPGRGDVRRVTFRLYAEMQLLARANWTVGTFSSNVGRLANIFRFDKPADSMQSLDGGWFAGWPPPADAHYSGRRQLAGLGRLDDEFDPLTDV